MKVLVTGSLGNVGMSAVEELARRGHKVRGFDLPTRRNQRLRRKLPAGAEIVWGDLRDQSAVADAVRGQDVVVHLAFIIPKMSATGVGSEDRPEWAREINVGGTRNLINAMDGLDHPPKLLFTSSCHVYGTTQDQVPPRAVSDPARPTEHYTHHKVACEEMVRSSGLSWTIFRLAATLPLAIKMDPAMFDVPLDNRMEFVHTRDVGTAIANAVTSASVWGKTLNIGGGPRCQYVYREIASRVLEAFGVGMLPEQAFGATPFATDWLDTAESQALLSYQQRDLSDYIDDMTALLGARRHLIRAFRPIVRAWLLKRSPYLSPATTSPGGGGHGARDLFGRRRRSTSELT